MIRTADLKVQSKARVFPLEALPTERVEVGPRSSRIYGRSMQQCMHGRKRLDARHKTSLICIYGTPKMGTYRSILHMPELGKREMASPLPLHGAPFRISHPTHKTEEIQHPDPIVSVPQLFRLNLLESRTDASRLCEG
jgi:hypothetical protein